MKKFTVILITICLMFAFAFTAIACVDRDDDGREILGRPTITIDGNVIRWEKVKNAEKYSVNLTAANMEEQNIEVDITTATIGPFADNVTKVNVKVKAVGDGVKTADGKYSNVKEYIQTIRLATPQINAIEKVGEDYKLTWNAIPNATAYNVRMECVELASKNKMYNGITETQLTISKADMSNLSEYRFTIQSVGDATQNFVESAWGGNVKYDVSGQLNAPKDVYYNKSGIYWQSVSNAKQYKVYYRLSSVPDDEYQLLTEITNTSLRKDDIVANAILAEGNKYQFKVSAINKDKATIYLESNKADVMTSTKPDATIATLIKLQPVTDIKIANNQLSFIGHDTDISGYTIEFISNNTNNQATIDIAKQDGNNNYTVDLNEKFKTLDKGNWGKVFTIQVYAKSNDDGSLLESKKEDVTNEIIVSGKVSKVLAEYCYTGYFDSYTSDSGQWATTTVGDDTTTEYKVVDSLAKFVYMLNDNRAEAKYYIKDFNGNNAKIYGGGDFNGVVVGDIVGGSTIKDLILIKDSTKANYSLFNTIGENARVSDLSFINFLQNSNAKEVENSNGTKEKTFTDNYIGVNASFLAMKNNGTISGIYYNADVLALGNYGGLVYNNMSTGTITSCTVTGTIKSEGNIGGIVYTNAGQITNSYVMDATITSTNVIVEQKETNIQVINEDKIYIVSGIVAIGTNGNINNCGILNADISVNKVSEKQYNSVTGYVGGIIGHNKGTSIKECYIESFPNATIKTSLKVFLDYSNTAISASNRNIGGVIGLLELTQNASIESSYIRNVDITGTDGRAGGMVARISSANSANLTIAKVFIENGNISGQEKDVICYDANDKIIVSSSYMANSKATYSSKYSGITKCLLGELNSNLAAIIETPYIYQNSLSTVILKNTLISARTTLNLDKKTVGRDTYSSVYSNDKVYKIPNKQTGIDKSGKFVDRYMIDGKVFFITVNVK